MKTRSSSQFVIITVFAMVILSVNGYQMKFAFSQDEETPDFGGTKAPFSPLPENERSPPPPPSNATQVNELPKNLFVEENDTDSEPLAIANKTELLEVLPANATSVIEFIDSSLKNSTGQGLLPPGIMNNVTDAGQLNASSSPSGEKQNITTILDFLNKENLIKEVLPLISPANKSATSEDLEEIVEPQQPSNVSENATTPEEQPASENATTPEEQPASENATTPEEQPASENATTSEEQPPGENTAASEELPPSKNATTSEELPPNDEAVPPVSQESDQQLPPVEDKTKITIEEPLNTTELAPSNNTKQGLMNNTDFGHSKDNED